MLDLFLRAADEASLKAALPDFLNEEGNFLTSNHQWALDLIGPVTTTNAVLDLDGNVTAPAVVDERFHANLRLIDEALAPLVPDAIKITVNSPRRVWA